MPSSLYRYPEKDTINFPLVMTIIDIVTCMSGNRRGFDWLSDLLNCYRSVTSNYNRFTNSRTLCSSKTYTSIFSVCCVCINLPVTASNGGRSPSSGFPNSPRAQLQQLSTDWLGDWLTGWMAGWLTDQPTNQRTNIFAVFSLRSVLYQILDMHWRKSSFDHGSLMGRKQERFYQRGQQKFTIILCYWRNLGD
jgi:hypothetical protein